MVAIFERDGVLAQAPGRMVSLTRHVPHVRRTPRVSAIVLDMAKHPALAGVLSDTDIQGVDTESTTGGVQL